MAYALNSGPPFQNTGKDSSQNGKEKIKYRIQNVFQFERKLKEFKVCKFLVFYGLQHLLRWAGRYGVQSFQERRTLLIVMVENKGRVS